MKQADFADRNGLTLAATKSRLSRARIGCIGNFPAIARSDWMSMVGYVVSLPSEESVSLLGLPISYCSEILFNNISQQMK
jgi:hypothetical protein